MELLYLYINLSESEFIEKKGFNFSPNYNFEVNYQNGTYILSSNKRNDWVPDGFFDGDGCISNITAIVGENGSGKTMLLDYILYSGIVSKPDKDKKYYNFFIDKFKYREQISVYKDKGRLVCYHNVGNVISIDNIDCIDITKDSKELSNMLINNDGYKNMTKIAITNSLYSKSVVSTHGCLDTITLNPNSINTLKQSFYKKSLGLDNEIYGVFYMPQVSLVSLSGDLSVDLKYETSNKASRIHVLKVWKKDNKKSRPKSIEVCLLRSDGIVVDKVKLNSDNQWSYTWDSLSTLYTYSVMETSVPSGYKESCFREMDSVVLTNTGSYTDKKKEKKDDELAFTGQLWWPVPVLLFVGLVLFGLGRQLRNEK